MKQKFHFPAIYLLLLAVINHVLSSNSAINEFRVKRRVSFHIANNEGGGAKKSIPLDGSCEEEDDGGNGDDDYCDDEGHDHGRRPYYGQYPPGPPYPYPPGPPMWPPGPPMWPPGPPMWPPVPPPAWPPGPPPVWPPGPAPPRPPAPPPRPPPPPPAYNPAAYQPPPPPAQCQGHWSQWTNVRGAVCSDTCGRCGKIAVERFCEPKGCQCTGPRTDTHECNLNVCYFPRYSCCKPYKAGILNGHHACVP